MLSIKKLVLNILFSTLILTGCKNQGPSSIYDYDLVITTPDTSYQFDNTMSFTIIDSIAYLSESYDLDHSPHFDSEYNNLIINSIKDQFINLGYSYQSPDQVEEAPNLLVTVSALKKTYAGVYNWYEWGNWWNYWSGWKGWTPWYPWVNSSYTAWHPFYIGYYEWDQGSIIIDLLDINNTNQSDKMIPVRWNAILNGIINTNSEDMQDRFLKNLDQVFFQSPYLKGGKAN